LSLRASVVKQETTCYPRLAITGRSSVQRVGYFQSVVASSTRIRVPMSKVTLKQFLKQLRRCGLIEEKQLEATLDKCRQKNGGELPKLDAVAEFLINTGRITQWQCNKLLSGKYKGFFLGKYKLLKHLGTGGMSTVFLAEHVLIHRQVAIKVLPKSRVGEASYLARFRLEALAVAALDHSNIVRAYDVDSDGDIHYLVMEYVDGPNLKQMVKKEGPADFTLATDYIAQAAEGLQHIHDAGLIHRDVKPSNLLVNRQGVIKVLDMGLAQFDAQQDPSVTIAHRENVLGTADYLSPEQAINSHTVDGRSDLYSLGCTFYFLLTGRAPFSNGTLAQRIAKHQLEKPAPIRDQRSDCPEIVETVCYRLMAKKVDNRYPSASHVADFLRSWLKSNSPIVSVESGSTSTVQLTPISHEKTIPGGTSEPVILQGSKDTGIQQEGDTTKIENPGKEHPSNHRQKSGSSLKSGQPAKSAITEDQLQEHSSTIDQSGLFTPVDARGILNELRERSAKRSKAPPIGYWAGLAIVTVLAIALSVVALMD